jgi:nitroreductase
MTTIEAIQTRRAIKHFDANHKMTKQELDKLFSLAILSPTAFNIQHWRFVVIEDISLRKKIKDAAWGQNQVTDSSLFIVLCADIKAWEKNPKRYWVNAPKEVQEFMLPSIDSNYRDKEQLQKDEALRSCGMVAQTIMLAAKSMGYDSCPMAGFDSEEVAKLIKLPSDHIIAMSIAVGKASVEASPRAGQLSLHEVVIQNKFSREMI